MSCARRELYLVLGLDGLLSLFSTLMYQYLSPNGPVSQTIRTSISNGPLSDLSCLTSISGLS